MKALTKTKQTGKAAVDGSALLRAQRAVKDALATATLAVEKALLAGHALIELKAEVGHAKFEEAVTQHFPEISDRTARRWMETAERALEASGVVIDMPATRLLTAPDSELSPSDIEARQLYLDFTEGRSLKELREVVVDGEEPSRITRAANGRKLGGKGTKDRKDWPEFIGRKLSDISTHLKHWESMTPAQQEITLSKFNTGTKWPTPVLHFLKKMAGDELKTR